MAESGFIISVWVPPTYDDGVRIITKTNWEGEIVISERAATKTALTTVLNSRVGVYLLIGVDQSDSPTIYVGEGVKSSSKSSIQTRDV